MSEEASLCSVQEVIRKTVESPTSDLSSMQ